MNGYISAVRLGHQKRIGGAKAGSARFFRPNIEFFEKGGEQVRRDRRSPIIDPDNVLVLFTAEFNSYRFLTGILDEFNMLDCIPDQVIEHTREKIHVQRHDCIRRIIHEY